MAFYLTVTQGADEGKTFRVEPGECVIGRSPSSTIVLEDDSVAWEHVMLREDGGRLVLQNLSAIGSRVRGRRVTDEVKLASNDEIELTEQCRVVVHQRLGGRARIISKRTGVLLGIGALVIVIGAVVAWQLKPAPPPPRRVTEAHWRQAYNRIEDRLEQWTARRVFPEEALTVYRDGWRLERAQNPAAAAAKWEQMRALLLTLPFPGAEDEDTRIVEMAKTNSKALRVIMGWDLESSSTDFQWNTDETYADALVWFVRRRAEYSRRRAEEQQR
ncbi:MAG: FHA domain-containing protein [Planctomycetota bacterium]